MKRLLPFAGAALAVGVSLIIFAEYRANVFLDQRLPKISTAATRKPDFVKPSDLVKSGSVHGETVCAEIADSEITYSAEPKIELRFSITDLGGESAAVPVVYLGIRPDSFSAGKQLRLRGDFIDGTFRAESILTQSIERHCE